MIRLLKINTSALICLAFLFRLLFINVSLLPQFNTSNHNILTQKHFSFLKKRKDITSVREASAKDLLVTEIIAENNDTEEEPVKVSSFTLINFLYSCFRPSESVQKSGSPFDLIKCNLFPKRYLALSILRI